MFLGDYGCLSLCSLSFLTKPEPLPREISSPGNTEKKQPPQPPQSRRPSSTPLTSPTILSIALVAQQSTAAVRRCGSSGGWRVESLRNKPSFSQGSRPVQGSFPSTLVKISNPGRRAPRALRPSFFRSSFQLLPARQAPAASNPEGEGSISSFLLVLFFVARALHAPERAAPFLSLAESLLLRSARSLLRRKRREG